MLASLDSDGGVTYNGRVLDVERRGLPVDSEIALAVQSAGVVHGRFLLTAASRVVRPSPEQLGVAVALATQVGAALAATNIDGHPTEASR
jgi:hypothetical protein